MRTIKMLALLAATAAPLAAQRTMHVNLAPTSEIKVLGTSNVHDWTLASTSLDAVIEVPATGAAELGSGVKALTVSIPVVSLKSGKGGMDRNAYKALHAEVNPTIRYRMTAYQSSPKDGAYAATVKGLLTVNGVERPVTLAATVTPDGKGGVRAVGTATFKQTEFGIKPVTAMMGTIRCGDEVTIRFDLSGTAAQLLSQLPRE